jgi:hypothetical protein
MAPIVALLHHCCCLSTSTRRALMVILLVINIFSSFNDIDPLHMMLVYCCVLCCRVGGPIAAPYDGSNHHGPLRFDRILPSFLSRTQTTSLPNPSPTINQPPNQIISANNTRGIRVPRDQIDPHNISHSNLALLFW